MALSLVKVGRIAFIILMGLQAYSLASYPAKYEDNRGLYGLTALYLPAVLFWFRLMRKEENLHWLFAVWLLYVWIALVPFIGIIFGRTDTIEKKLNKEMFFGPNILKITLCLSPVLLLLLLSTGTDSMFYREQIWLLSLRIALDLFDGVEMLEVILEENELCNRITRHFERSIIAFVCISFLLSPLQLIEIESRVLSKCKTALRITSQIICVNGVFLGLRLGLFLGYGRDASIFIAKNGIIIALGFFEICSTCGWCGCEDFD